MTKALLLDPKAATSDPEKPAFAASPANSKPYHGFPLIEATCIDGYCYGAVTDFRQPDSARGCTIGDGYVEAPDGTRAGLVWEVGEGASYRVDVEPDDARWGVYHFTVVKPVDNVEDMTEVFRGMLPVLREFHAQWRKC